VPKSPNSIKNDNPFKAGTKNPDSNTQVDLNNAIS